MPPFDGLFVRDNFGDTGEGPPPGGPLYASPDIIPYSTNALTEEQAVSTYDDTRFVFSLENSVKNNVYVRVKNTSTVEVTGKIYLYATSVNVGFTQVTQWVQLRPALDETKDHVTVEETGSGGVTCGQQPFVYAPAATGHFCLVACVETDGVHPNPKPASDFSSVGEFENWVKANPNVAFHNVSVQTGSVTEYTADLVYNNGSAGSEMVQFELGYRGVPAGSEFWISADGLFESDKALLEGAGTYDGWPPESLPTGKTTIYLHCTFAQPLSNDLDLTLTPLVVAQQSLRAPSGERRPGVPSEPPPTPGASFNILFRPGR